MGFFDAFKKSRRQINRENQEQGRAGERKIREKYEYQGYKVKRTGRGHDLKAERRNWITGKKDTKYIEVKTGNSRLSKLQKKKRGRLGGRYVTERLKPTPLGLLSDNRESDKPRTRKRKGGLGGLWGSRGSSRSLFGSGSGAKGTSSLSSSSRGRSKSQDIAKTLFGSGSGAKGTSSSSSSRGRSKSKSQDIAKTLFGSGKTRSRKRGSSGGGSAWGSRSSAKRRKDADGLW